MLILNPDLPGERHEEMIERVRSIITEAGGTVDHLNDWGRRKIAFPIDRQADGTFIVITCHADAATLDEVERVMTISKDVVLRSTRIKLSRAQTEFAMANGAPAPVDERPEPDSRPRGGPRGPRRRPR